MAFEMTLASMKNPGQTFYSEIHVYGQSLCLITVINSGYHWSIFQMPRRDLFWGLFTLGIQDRAPCDTAIRRQGDTSLQGPGFPSDWEQVT